MKSFSITLVAVAVSAWTLSSGAAEAQTGADPASSVGTTRAALGKWVETQQIISKEKKEWREGKEILQSRIELLKTEIASLEEKIKQAEANAADAEKKRLELVAQNETLKAAAAAMGQVVSELEAKLRRLFKILPEPIQLKLNPLYQRIPADPTTTKVTLAERFQNILGILNEANKLNGEITLATEVRSLADGRPAEVKTLYVGLCQAYFLSAKGEAGVGQPSADGWRWKSANHIAPDVSEAMNILANKASPRFVPLPVTIQ
jgi:hypothetical protein